jgi:NADH-quinone oxidoreductase subunit N
VLMYFSDAQGDTVGVVTPSALTQVAIGAGALLTLVLGVAPSSLLLLADNASQFLR